jgi:chaperonin cofactor prefoldin
VEFILLGLSTLSVCFTLFTFIELQSVKEELESLNWKYAFGTADKSVGLRVGTPDVPEETPEESADLSDSAEVLTATEIARIEREEAFDRRIAEIKEELALRGEPVTRRGTEAPILHPHVHNLPHTAIPEFSDELPDVEITY